MKNTCKPPLVVIQPMIATNIGKENLASNLVPIEVKKTKIPSRMGEESTDVPTCETNKALRRRSRFGESSLSMSNLA
jgi:hypothetical protein